MKKFLGSRLAFVLLLVVIATGLPILTYVLINLQDAGGPPPLTYTQRPDDTRRLVCPGETFSYDFSLRVTKTPTVLLVYRSVWSEAAGSNVVGARVPKVLAYTWLEQVAIDRSSSFTVPYKTDSGKPLAPGLYSLNVGAVAEGRTTEGFAVPFEIRPGCRAAST